MGQHSQKDEKRRRGGIVGGFRAVWRLWRGPAVKKRLPPRVIQRTKQIGDVLAYVPIAVLLGAVLFGMATRSLGTMPWATFVIVAAIATVMPTAIAYVRVWDIRQRAAAAEFRMCPECGYSLADLDATGKCPECGAGYTAQGLREVWKRE